jgi:hypothetical protein
MTTGHDLTITDLGLTLVPEPGSVPFRPVIHGGVVHLSNIAFVKIVRQALRDEINTPYARLSLRSTRLIEGGAEIVLHARKAFIDTDLTTRVAFTPAGNGDLRATVTALRLGFLPAAKLLDFVLDSVNRYPGLRKSGSHSVDINLSILLQARDVPVDLDAGVEQVEANEHGLTVTLG